jgi:hypothetical protein
VIDHFASFDAPAGFSVLRAAVASGASLIHHRYKQSISCELRCCCEVLRDLKMRSRKSLRSFE